MLPAVPAALLLLLSLILLIGPLDRLRDPLFAVSDRPRPRRWLAAGLVLGLGALAVASMLLLAPVALWWLRRTSRTWRAPLLFLLGCTLAIAPVTLRNGLVSGDWVLISRDAGLNFYIGNNPQYERTTAIHPSRARERLGIVVK